MNFEEDKNMTDENAPENIGQAEDIPNTPPETDTPRDESAPGIDIAKYEKVIEALNAKLSYAKADFDNFRKRTEKQLEESAKFSVSGFAKDLLSVTDNLNRALGNQSNITSDPVAQALLEGVKMTDKELHGVLTKYGVEKVAPQPGDPFDHNLHQAITNVPTNEHPPGTVYQVMQTGYVIHSRLLRPAIVSVSQAK